MKLAASTAAIVTTTIAADPNELSRSTKSILFYTNLFTEQVLLKTYRRF